MRIKQIIVKTANLAFLIVLIMSLSYCKKYPEGGLHLFSNKNLIGGWSLEKYEVDYIDSTNLIITNNNELVKNNFLEIGFSKPSYNFSIYSGEILYRFRTDLSSKKMLIGGRVNGGITNTSVDSAYMNIGSGIYARNIFSPESKRTEWKILKLNSKYLIIEHHSNKYYKVILKKTK